MASPTVTPASIADRDRTIQTITLGFIADPVARWIWPDAQVYLAAMPKFAAAFGGKGFDHGSAYVADDYKAAALWLPPGVEPDGEAVDVLFAETVSSDIESDVAAMFLQMEAYHPGDQPCWYLPMIATDPAYMGQGLGAAILEHALGQCDKDGVIAYLESSNPRNISLYRRHGFEAIGEIQAGSSPAMTPMVRQPGA